jgi:hypothetical protein
MINKTIFLLTILFISGCSQHKCVYVVDKENKMVSYADLIFSSTKEPNADGLGGLVTSWNRMYEKKIGKTDEKGEICFERHVNKDSRYEYTNLRAWRFYEGDRYAYFNDFESIPNRVVLKKKISDKKMDLFLNNDGFKLEVEKVD